MKYKQRTKLTAVVYLDFQWEKFTRSKTHNYVMVHSSLFTEERDF